MSVMVCSPLRDKRAHISYIIGLMQINGAYGGWMPMGGQGDIHVARTTLANQFMKSKHDALVFIDGDIGFTRQDFLELVGSDAVYVSGLYPGKADQPEFIYRDINMKVVPIDQVPRNGLHKVGLIPTGFLKIHRSVFETIAQKGVAQAYAKGQHHHFFPSLIVDDYLQSEDYSFCHLAKQAGFTPVINAGIRLEHDGRRIP